MRKSKLMMIAAAFVLVAAVVIGCPGNGDNGNGDGYIPPSPASFHLSNLSITPSEIAVGDEITVTVTVNNSGGQQGTHQVTLKIDAVTVDTKSVTLSGGASQNVSFTTVIEEDGDHQIEVNDLTAIVTVLGGQLPTLVVGVQWTWSYVMMDQTTATLTQEIIGEETVEGRDCYVISFLFDPPMSHTYDDTECTYSMLYWSDKTTALYGVKMETTITCNGQVTTSTQIYSYDPWAPLFPLDIGKEAETVGTTTQYMDGEQVGDPVIFTENYRVDSREDVTVVAGTFSCWKIIMYDGDDNITQIMWWSDLVKSVVKMTDSDGNMIMELLSYSVS
jgi:hypothetical protein